MSDVHAFTIDWLRGLGVLLLKGCRKDVRVLDDGRVRMVVEYPSMADLRAVVAQIEALKAMVAEENGGGQ